MKEKIGWSIIIGVPLIIMGFLLGATFINIQQRPVKMIANSNTSSAEVVLPPSSNQVEAEINKLRTAKGLHTFNTEAPLLDQAAQARAENMCAANDWSHNLGWQVLDQYYSYSYAGENLYYGSLVKDQASKAVHDWSMSPSHMKNLMSEYSEIGVGVKACPGFQGRSDAVIITNYFGVPR